MTNKTENQNVIIDRLIDLAGQTEIVHHIPGRIRLKVKLPGLLLARDLEAPELVNFFAGIVDARTNVAARSIVISYDTQVIAPDLWEHLVNGQKDPSQKNRLREILQGLSKKTIRK
jgi:hypothetical protein